MNKYALGICVSILAHLTWRVDLIAGHYHNNWGSPVKVSSMSGVARWGTTSTVVECDEWDIQQWGLTRWGTTICWVLQHRGIAINWVLLDGRTPSSLFFQDGGQPPVESCKMERQPAMGCPEMWNNHYWYEIRW